MENLSPKQEFWGLQRVALGQVELCGEHSALIGGALRPSKLNEEMPVITFALLSIEPNDWLLLQLLNILDGISLSKTYLEDPGWYLLGVHDIIARCAFF